MSLSSSWSLGRFDQFNQSTNGVFMKSLHQIVIIAIGIILGFGWSSGNIYEVRGYSEVVYVNWKYLAPVSIYLLALLAVGLFRLMTITGETENGTVKTAAEKTGKA